MGLGFLLLLLSVFSSSHLNKHFTMGTEGGEKVIRVPLLWVCRNGFWGIHRLGWRNSFQKTEDKEKKNAC